VEILNDNGYVDADPQPQSVVWEQMNVPIARALRGLLYVLWDLSQVDPSDLSSLFAGRGRLRIGFSEIDPPPGGDPSDHQIEQAVRGCWENPYCCFNGPVGTSLICIQGQWSNVADAKIKGRLAALADSACRAEATPMPRREGGASRAEATLMSRRGPQARQARVGSHEQGPYTPLYARAFQMPKPWGVTALFAEYTGNHAPVDVDWAFEQEPLVCDPTTNEPAPVVVPTDPTEAVEPTPIDEVVPTLPQSFGAVAPESAFSTFWEFALALNRADPSALALAQDGDQCRLTIDESELKKLLGMFWFRPVFARLSPTWRERILTVLSERIAIPNHVLRIGRQDVCVSEVKYAQLKELFSRISVPDAIQSDLRLLMAIGNLWGQDGLDRLRFTDPPPINDSLKLSGLLQGLRR
jgi:hypothetical protein